MTSQLNILPTILQLGSYVFFLLGVLFLGTLLFSKKKKGRVLVALIFFLLGGILFASAIFFSKEEKQLILKPGESCSTYTIEDFPQGQCPAGYYCKANEASTSAKGITILPPGTCVKK